MQSTRWLSVAVGLLLVLGLLSLLFLAFKASDFSHYNAENSYEVSAEFDNIGALKPRATVSIAGVKIGQVERIVLDGETYKALVYLRISNQHANIPVDSSATILTAGLLGANYIALSPGFEDSFLQNGDVVRETHPALILEEMIGQLLFSMKEDKSGAKAGEATPQ